MEESNIIFYRSAKGDFKVEVWFDDGKAYLTKVYHLDAIISVGYRVNTYENERLGK